MSAFFFAINRNKSIFEYDVASKMMEAISVFGHDQASLVVKDHYALGYQSHWSVPEEVGECQPLNEMLPEAGQTGELWHLFHGRVDNRNSIISLLEGLIDAGAVISDAQLVLQFYQCFGEKRLKEIIGPFVFVVFNPVTGDVVAARDPMGGRSLFYRVTGEHILMSTYEMALVAHPAVDYKFYHERLARIIARVLEDKSSSPIKGLTPLEPAQMIRVNAHDSSSVDSRYFYSFDPNKRIALNTDQDYADQFKALLTQAVKRRTRSIGSVGSMLSGGYDSVPMSILASEVLTEKEGQLTAFSWSFDTLSEVDERVYSSKVCKRFGIKQICINCDDVWPAFDDSMYFNPVMPFSTPYVALQQVALKSASEHGVNTILSGVHGDLLYAYTDSILWELIKSRRFHDAFIEAKHRLKESAGVVSWFKQYVLRPLPIVQRLLEARRLKASLRCEWLAEDMQDKLKNESSHLSKYAVKSLRPIAYELLLSGFAGEDAAYGRHMDALYGVERRYPFRDRDLCEFMLSIPSAQLKFMSSSRPIVKRAFKSEFASVQLDRTKKTSFYPWVENGIKNNRDFMQWFDSEHKHWSFYVNKCYFDESGAQKLGKEMVQWQCGYYDYWKSVCYDKQVIKLDLNNEQKN